MGKLKNNEIVMRRTEVIQSTHEKIRSLIFSYGVNSSTLEMIKDELIRLAINHGDLFPVEDFPIASFQQAYTLQRLAWNSQNNSDFLYLSSHGPGRTVLPHNHQTFAVTAGLDGDEENVIYERGEKQGMLKEIGRTTVKLGNGAFLLPGEIHSIRCSGHVATRTFRFYGVSLLEQTTVLDRSFWDLDNQIELRLQRDGTFTPV